MRIELSLDLASRLYTAARRLGRKPEECALSAILCFVQDCEDAATLGAQLGSNGEVRLREPDWTD
jgi:hypothetical protein